MFHWKVKLAAKLLMIPLLMCWSLTTHGQVCIDNTSFTHTENFNSLSSSGTSNTWTNNSTISGWYATNVSTGDYTTYRAGTGSSSTTGLYSFGTGSGDRALGSLNQNASGDIAHGILMENNSGSTLTEMTISFTVEQWRRVQTSSKGNQRVQLSFQIANSIDVSSSGILNGSFVNIPEGYLITPDSTTINASSALDGNLAANRVSVSVHYPISLPDADEIFIRFYDENASGLDKALAVDDLSIGFSTDARDEITATVGYGISNYLNEGIVTDIPTESDGIAYTKVSESNFTDLETLFDAYYSSDFSTTKTEASDFDYSLVDITADGEQFYVLRKESSSTYYWGTYVRKGVPGNDCITIQSPHPVKDTHTGTQGAAVFELVDGGDFMVTGISRCTSSEYSTCSGTTSICGSSGSYRISDAAHNDSTAFHLASVALNNNTTDHVFIQLHGFGQEMDDPDFIFSNGTEDTPTTDFLASLKQEYADNFPSFDVDVVHLDELSKLRAFTNVLGRTLNNYASNICTAGTQPDNPTGQFMHLEQFFDYREQVSNYSDLATLLENSVDCSAALPLEWLDFTVSLSDLFRINLKWTVAKEINVDRFEVERSSDGHRFNKIQALNSNSFWSPGSYHYVDAQLPPGTYFYMIKQIDFDGYILRKAV